MQRSSLLRWNVFNFQREYFVLVDLDGLEHDLGAGRTIAQIDPFFPLRARSDGTGTETTPTVGAYIS